MKRRQPPAPPAGAMPEHLAVFRVEDWCDPTATPPEWYMAALDGRVFWSLADQSSVEDYWWLHARMAHRRAVGAWLQEHAPPLTG